MKPGTIIEIDGDEATVVYSGLDGYGVKWGRHDCSELLGLGTNGAAMVGVNSPEPPEDFDLHPEAMLRDKYPGATLPCIGQEFDVLETPK